MGIVMSERRSNWRDDPILQEIPEIAHWLHDPVRSWMAGMRYLMDAFPETDQSRKTFDHARLLCRRCASGRRGGLRSMQVQELASRGMTAGKIAGALGCCVGTVYGIAKRNGLHLTLDPKAKRKATERK